MLKNYFEIKEEVFFLSFNNDCLFKQFCHIIPITELSKIIKNSYNKKEELFVYIWYHYFFLPGFCLVFDVVCEEFSLSILSIARNNGVLLNQISIPLKYKMEMSLKRLVLNAI